MASRGILALLAISSLLLSGAWAQGAEVEDAATTSGRLSYGGGGGNAGGSSAGDGFGYLQSARSDTNLYLCLTESFADALAKKLVFPRGALSTHYEYARSMPLGHRGLPAVVVYAHDTPDVQKAVVCAHKSGYRVSAAGRRHSYMGWSIVSDYVSIDMSNLTSVVVEKLSSTNYIAKAGVGNTNALLLAGVAKQNVPGLASLIGSCPSVGITGYALGGGQGDITPYVGLGSDQLLGLKMVTWDGRVVEANKDKNSDLFWASKGGGGGMGILTELTLQLHIMPDPTRYTRFALNYRPSARRQVSERFLEWLASGKADDRMGGSGGLTQGGGLLIFQFLGPVDEGLKILRNAGLLKSSWLSTTVPASLWVNFVERDAAAAGVPTGVTANQVPKYEYLMATQICKNYNLDKVGDTGSITWADYGAPELNAINAATCNRQAALDALLTHLSKPDAPLNTGMNGAWATPTHASTGGRMVKHVPTDCWKSILDVLDDKVKVAGELGPLASIIKTALPFGFNHWVHGKPMKIAEDATPYPWRKLPLLLTVDVPPLSEAAYQGVIAAIPGCAAFSAEAARLARLVNPIVETATGAEQCTSKALARVLSANSAIVEQFLGVFNSAACKASTVHSAGYYNYMVNDRADWQTFYWGDNYARLAKIKAKWDPYSRFSKPYTVEVAA